MTVNKINSNNNIYLNAAIIVGSGVIGGAGGYTVFTNQKNTKEYRKYVSDSLEELRNDRKKLFSDLDKKVYNNIKEQKEEIEYINKIDTFEKQGKKFNVDYGLKDVLNEADFDEYLKTKEPVLKQLKEQENDIIKTFKHEYKIKRNKFIAAGLFIGIAVSSLVLYLNNVTKNKNK
jgi:predicted GTPase